MAVAVDEDVLAIARISAVPQILQVITEVTGLRLALIARVTRERWKACAVLDTMSFGLEVGGELDIATTLCNEVREAQKAVVISHASRDPVYCHHRTPKLYRFESYISVPLFRSDGEFFGTLCALDSHPVDLSDGKTLSLFTLLATLLANQIDAEQRHADRAQALLDAREAAELREQFIAVLGHDLRTPLSAITAGASLLLSRSLGERDRTAISRIAQSANRMARLINDVLDFARGRLGGGIIAGRSPLVDLHELVRSVTDECASAHPGRVVRVEAGPCGAVSCDQARVAQMLSNLVSNALDHGAADAPVDVSLRGLEREVEIAVTNRGEPIAAEALPRLFQPYQRGAGSDRSAGLGLGLYIVDQIVRAHGGRVEVRSSAESGTTFSVRLPRD